MRFLVSLFLLVLVVAVIWVLREPILDRLGREASASARQAGEHAREATRGATRRIREHDWDLDLDRLLAELARTGRVVRSKAAQAARRLDEGTRDARTSAKIKARYALDPQLKARDIHVDTTDGLVTLSGRVDTPDDLARAIRMALEEDDVIQVTSTLQVNARRTGASLGSGRADGPAPQPSR